MKTGNRRKDAYEKIMLGGLIVKAGLREADKAFLLGVLIKAAELNKNSEEYASLKQIGTKEFQS
ncbi:conjugal transfer protein TraD [Ochrobactrum sp. GPK 3]